MLATIAVAAATSLAVLHWQGRVESVEPDFHHWMHHQLQLTPAQHKALEPIEQQYENNRRGIQRRIDSAGRDLAAAVRAGDGDSPAIRNALKELHIAQSELQQATLDHFFQMKEFLDPAQAEKLLQWTHDRLLHP